MTNYDALLERAQRALLGKQPDEILQETRAIVGLRADQMGADAAEALKALKARQKPTATAMAALELVIRMARPSILCTSESIGVLGAPRAPVFPDWTSFDQAIKDHLNAIGRVEVLADPNDFGGPRYDAVGTGFLVEDDVMMTNAHVLDAISSGTMALDRGMARFNLSAYYGRRAAHHHVDLLDVVAFNRELDLALLRCAPPPGTGEPIPLTNATPLAEHRAVCVIGHPLDDPRSPMFKSILFGGVYGMKRASPGEIIDITRSYAFHDCSTLGGSSGAPVFDISSAQIVGIHASGKFLFANKLVRAEAAHAWLSSVDR